MFSEPAIPFTRPDHPIDMAPTRDPTAATSEPPVTLESKVAEEEQICYHEGGDLFAEDVEQHMALLPEVVSTTDEVTIEDIQATRVQHARGDRSTAPDHLATQASPDRQRKRPAPGCPRRGL
ncbi:unnamed protein product [Phytophthora fragariaefolia]|uniref:Unnamed protein product n=1 Tax=Phytophthora fragariaefolia TaxID=1490495 RepID=A0A9W6YGW2_9STRA|nr:unnamed protein product [Phytophthora fragariaefolia]